MLASPSFARTDGAAWGRGVIEHGCEYFCNCVVGAAQLDLPDS